MKKFFAGSAVVASLFVMSASAESWSGFIGDSKCKHTGAEAKDVACAKTCIKKGADPVFVTGDKVLKFDAASMDKAKAMAGEKVTVNGSVSGDTLTVTSIDKAS
jgi:hypothetical protein